MDPSPIVVVDDGSGPASIGLNLSDRQTGLRAIPRRFAELSLSIRANRYEFETEQLIVLNSHLIAFGEIPIQTIYLDDNGKR